MIGFDIGIAIVDLVIGSVAERWQIFFYFC